MIYGKMTIDTIAYVRGIDLIYENYKRAGAIIYQPLTINEYNRKQFLIKDPSGYTTKFIQPVNDSNRPKIFYSAKVFYVKNKKQTLDYYQGLGFNCDYNSDLAFRDEIRLPEFSAKFSQHIRQMTQKKRSAMIHAGQKSIDGLGGKRIVSIIKRMLR